MKLIKTEIEKRLTSILVEENSVLDPMDAPILANVLMSQLIDDIVNEADEREQCLIALDCQQCPNCDGWFGESDLKSDPDDEDNNTICFECLEKKEGK